MTTNGINLEKKIDDLVSAGLSRINVSLDTVCPDTFAKLPDAIGSRKYLKGYTPRRPLGWIPSKLTRCCCGD